MSHYGEKENEDKRKLDRINFYQKRCSKNEKIIEIPELINCHEMTSDFFDCFVVKLISLSEHYVFQVTSSLIDQLFSCLEFTHNVELILKLLYNISLFPIAFQGNLSKNVNIIDCLTDYKSNIIVIKIWCNIFASGNQHLADVFEERKIIGSLLIPQIQDNSYNIEVLRLIRIVSTYEDKEPTNNFSNVMKAIFQFCLTSKTVQLFHYSLLTVAKCSRTCPHSITIQFYAEHINEILNHPLFNTDDKASAYLAEIVLGISNNEEGLIILSKNELILHFVEEQASQLHLISFCPIIASIIKNLIYQINDYGNKLIRNGFIDYLMSIIHDHSSFKCVPALTRLIFSFMENSSGICFQRMIAPDIAQHLAEVVQTLQPHEVLFMLQAVVSVFEQAQIEAQTQNVINSLGTPDLTNTLNEVIQIIMNENSLLPEDKEKLESCYSIYLNFLSM